MTNEFTVDRDRLLKFLVHRVVALEVQVRVLMGMCYGSSREEGETDEALLGRVQKDTREAMTTLIPELELELFRQAGIPHGWLGELLRGWHEGETQPDPPENRSSPESTPGPT